MVASDAIGYELGGGMLNLHGDFHFGLVKKDYKALNGSLKFAGKESQMVQTSMVELGHVEVANSAGIVLGSGIMQGAKSELTLTSGVISSHADSLHTWTLMNTNIEENLVGRVTARSGDNCGTGGDQPCHAVIHKGSKRAYVSAKLVRHLAVGNAGGGVVTGGYLFPIGGMEGESSFFRPLILQLPSDLGETTAASVSPLVPSVSSDGMAPEWKDLVVPAKDGTLTLDQIANIFWKLELTGETSHDPNLRVAAEGLANVFNPKGLRIVQWDCDWTNPHLAGTYDISSGPTDDNSFAVNDWVNGIVNLTQEGVRVDECAIFGIAANGVENPIHMDPLTGGLAHVQFIHNLPIPVPVDLYLDGVRLVGGLTYQSATSYGVFAAGDHEVGLLPDGAPATEMITVDLPTLLHDQSYAVVVHGSPVEPSLKVITTRKSSNVENTVDAILIHGSTDLGSVDVRTIDPVDNTTPVTLLANNLSFDQATQYVSLEAGAHNVQVTTADNREEHEVFHIQLNDYRDESLTLNLSGNESTGHALLGVDIRGDVFLPQDITGVETEIEELPTEFTLYGNYPNPFNPSTRIQFDLPESAQVSLQVVDMLGREVMLLPAKEFEAGANRTIELNAINLASGTYLYRMIATGAESRYVKTGRMTLVK